MNDALALYGLAGEVVRALEPTTEADTSGLLMTFLAMFGAAVGDGPHAVADGSNHPARLNIVLVGRSSRARKGTSLAVVRRLFEEADPAFISERIIGGLASGEGLVADLARREAGLPRSVLIIEQEYARFLRVAGRSASLSAVVREAWDGGELRIMTRNKPLRATGTNVAMLAHITAEELRRRLSQTEIANGMANRFMMIWVERSKRLPSGGQLPQDELEVLGVRVGLTIERARQLGPLTRSAAAEARWIHWYNSLDDDVPGIIGSLLARAEAQVLRLMTVFAMLDGSSTIEVAHLEAALAVWEHAEASVRRVFAGQEPDPIISRLVSALEEAGPEGLDGSAQRDLFNRHLAGSRLAAARADLEERGIAHTVVVETGGRPRVVTRLVDVEVEEDDGDEVSSLPSLVSSSMDAEAVR